MNLVKGGKSSGYEINNAPRDILFGFSNNSLADFRNCRESRDGKSMGSEFVIYTADVLQGIIH